MYEKLYHILFSGITDALEQIDDGNAEEAAELLRRAQMDAEHVYVRWPDGE